MDKTVITTMHKLLLTTRVTDVTISYRHSRPHHTDHLSPQRRHGQDDLHDIPERGVEQPPHDVAEPRCQILRHVPQDQREGNNGEEVQSEVPGVAPAEHARRHGWGGWGVRVRVGEW